MSSSDVWLSAVLSWLQSFPVNNLDNLSQFSDLLDGVLFYRTLSSVAPVFFHSSLEVPTVQAQPQLNGARLVNLKQLVNSMEKCLGDVYSTNVEIAPQLNLSALLSLNEKDASPLMIDLVRYVLLCAITSPGKEDAVGRILALDESMQQELMVLINTGMEMFQPGGLHSVQLVLNSPIATKTVPFVSTPQVHDELNDLRSQLDALTASHRELKIAYAASQDQIALLSNDMEKKLSSSMKETKGELEDLHQQEISRLKKDLAAMEAQYMDAVESAKSGMESAEARALVLEEEGKERLKQIRLLQDDLDVAKDKVRLVAQHENTIARYKQKLDEAPSLSQIQSLEAFALEKQARITDLEGDVARLNAQKNALSKYKDLSLAQEVEVSNLKEQLSSKTNECHKFKVLSEEHASRVRELESRESSNIAPVQDRVISDSLSTQLGSQSQLAALIAENKRLSELNLELKVALPSLEDELDTVKRRSELEKEEFKIKLQECRDKIAEFEAKENIVVAKESTAGSEALLERITKLQHYEQVAYELTEQNMNLHAENDNLQSAVKSINTKYIAEREKLDNQSAEISSTKSQLEASKVRADKLEKKVGQLTDTIKKAQVEVNKNFEAIKKQFASHSQLRIQKMQQSYDQTIADLQMAIKAKEDEINVVNKLRIEQRDMFKTEQAVLSSAFYELGMEMAKLWNSNPNNSKNAWLATQRLKQ